MNLKAAVKHAIPPNLLNRTLLAFPMLYRTGLVDYETNLRPQRGIDDLLSQLDLALNIEGDIIECGSSRGGTAVIMAEHLRRKHRQKVVYAYDSFEGFDRAELHKERLSGHTNSPDSSFTSTSLAYVKAKFRKLGVDALIVPVKGYFQETLPHLRGSFCLALIDCDLQDSLVYCANMLWPLLSKGGRLLFDDYTSGIYLGARLGVDAFVQAHPQDIQEHGLLNRLYYVVKK
jgi:predicted O-methyltransferase YrrM